MQDAWRAYLEMALGLTEAPRKKAQKVAGDLVNRGGATAAQVQGLVEDLMSTGMANREALTNIVRYEVDRALGVVGLAGADEVAELRTRVKDLERRLREAQAGTAEASTVTGAGTGGDRLDRPAPLPAKKAVAKKAVKATPNAMPKAATTPPPAKSAATPAPSAPPVRPTRAAKKAAKAAPATPPVAKKTAAPVSGPAAKKAGPAASAPAKAAKKAARTAPAAPAGTTEAPTAAVKEAASATELPPAKKTAAKKASAKKAAPPAKFIDPGA
jgi:polyhydroxyalkanoate synthesis regulator phasin